MPLLIEYQAFLSVSPSTHSFLLQTYLNLMVPGFISELECAHNIIFIHVVLSSTCLFTIVHPWSLYQKFPLRKNPSFSFIILLIHEFIRY